MMTTREKVGQLFITAIDGYKITGDMIHLLQNYHIGGIYLSSKNMKNPKQVHHLTNNLQSFAGRHAPLFIATKLWGAAHHPLQKHLTPTLSQKKFGNLNNRLYTRQMAEIVGKELRGMGINFNLAPIVNAGTGDNYFSENLDLLAKHGRAALEGYQWQNVLAGVGYFPKDIAVKLPIYQTALHPFQYTIRHGAAAILTKNSKEASIFLRNEWAYDGLIVEDFTERACEVESVIDAINNGANNILLNETYKKQLQIIDAVHDALLDGLVSEGKIDDAIERIRKTKQDYQIGRLTQFDKGQFQARYSLFRSAIVREAVK